MVLLPPIAGLLGHEDTGAVCTASLAMSAPRDVAFGDALILHLPALRRYARGLCGNAALADDLVQDCMERALHRAGTLHSLDRLAPWLRAILYHLFVDGLRHRRHRGVQIDMADMANDIALSMPPEDRSDVHDFVRATMALSPEHRQILLLVGVEGLSYRDVADELGVPMGTVMSRLARARDKLRAALEAKPEPARTGIVLPWVRRG